jgi:O-antigen ligase
LIEVPHSDMPAAFMTHTHSMERSYVQQVFPLRYWLFVAYAVGIPTFVRFDSTGRTHEYGIFNAWSVSTMALTFLTAFLLITITILGGIKLLARKVSFSAWMWVSLLALFAISSVCEPQFRTLPVKPTDLYLSIYRLGEWVLGFSLLLSLYSREPVANSATLMASLLGRISWISVAIVWLILPIAPSLAYSTDATGADDVGHGRLGGALVHPDCLAALAGIACMHALTCLSGTRRVIGICIASLTVFLTYSRSGEATLMLALILYTIFFARGLVRFLGGLGAIVAAAAILLNITSIISYLARGNGLSNIATLSERTNVWESSLKAFAQRPFLGYGFIAGVKGALNDHWTYSHWTPPHTHNDFLQALLTGGIFAGALLLALFIKALWASIDLARRDPRYSLFMFVLVQLTLFAALVPLVSYQFGTLASLFVISFIAVVDHKALHKIHSRGYKWDASSEYATRTSTFELPTIAPAPVMSEALSVTQR